MNVNLILSIHPPMKSSGRLHTNSIIVWAPLMAFCLDAQAESKRMQTL